MFMLFIRQRLRNDGDDFLYIDSSSRFKFMKVKSNFN